MRKFVCALLGVLICAFLPFGLIQMLYLIVGLARDFFHWGSGNSPGIWGLAFLIFLFVFSLIATPLLAGFGSGVLWAIQGFSWRLQTRLVQIGALIAVAFYWVREYAEDSWETQILLTLFFGPLYFAFLYVGALYANDHGWNGYWRYFSGQTPYKPGEAPEEQAE